MSYIKKKIQLASVSRIPLFEYVPINTNSKKHKNLHSNLYNKSAKKITNLNNRNVKYIPLVYIYI